MLLLFITLPLFFSLDCMINHNFTFGDPAEPAGEVFSEKEYIDLLPDKEITQLHTSFTMSDYLQPGIEDLLKAGVSPNVQDSDSSTPLHYAAYFGNSANFVTLMRYGADDTLRNAEGLTPWDIACATSNLTKIIHEYYENIEDLLKAGVSPNVQDSHNKTPLHYAANFGNSANFVLLMRYGADDTLRNAEGLTPWDVARKTGNLTKIIHEYYKNIEFEAKDSSPTYKKQINILKSNMPKLERKV